MTPWKTLSAYEGRLPEPETEVETENETVEQPELGGDEERIDVEEAE